MRVVKELRSEVGFTCPVEGCGNPYLTWHHFDPPWRFEHHHRPEGLVALCWEHASKADAGAFTEDQIRELKRTGRERAHEIKGRFDWRRNEILAVVGGGFFYQTDRIFRIDQDLCIWFSRDDEGYLLLNCRLPTVTGEHRAQIYENFWTIPPDINDFSCPPSGRLIHVWYANGDRFRVEFFNVADSQVLAARYPDAGTDSWSDRLQYPVTGVELWERVAEAPIEFGPRETRIQGIMMSNNFFSRVGGAAIHLRGVPPGALHLAPLPEED